MLKDTIIKENTLLYDIEATYPKMGVASFDEAISHLVDTHIATFKANIDTGFTDKTLKNTLGISYEMYGTGQKIMSIKMLVYDFAGGPHPNTSYDTLTFDTAHKKILQFTDIFKDEPETLKVLYSLVKPILVKNILT